jgi:hypothetical protein
MYVMHYENEIKIWRLLAAQRLYHPIRMVSILSQIEFGGKKWRVGK